ncbi:J domain-containing protein [Sphingosinicella terrae]|jgi:DnaJ homolog subfamily C member 19|uniref:J domain-containing protein n=1 Tax=Sphingosinicella terrae TaxID=2172047 RepID=UPI000E0D9E05|nr:J domain-containing protein [Sphingosinicella terrae]
MTKLVLLLAVAAGIWLWWRRQSRLRPRMPAAEARALLGIGEQASLQEVRDAHRRLIARVHPDAGGSAELATKVNAARDALVAELNRKRA